MTIKFMDKSEGRRNVRIIIDGYEVFGMTLGPVDRASHDWLAEILEKSFKDAMEGAVRRARASDQAAMRKLLGIGS